MKKPPLDLMIGSSPHHSGKGMPPHSEDEDEPEGMGPDEEIMQACDEFFDAAGLKIPDDKREAACEALHALIDMAIEKHGGAPDSSGELPPDDGEEEK
jgi:hypothetical protein